MDFLIKNYCDVDLTPDYFEKHLNRSWKIIFHKANSLNLYRKRNKPWTKDEVLFLKKNYPDNSVSLDSICVFLNRKVEHVQRKASYLKLQRQLIYNKNDNYFDVLDTWEKCYILGLLSADGHNSITNNRIQLQLTEEDRHLLESISNQFQYTGILYKRKGIDEPNKFKSKPSYILRISSKKISQRLNELGLESRKSLTLRFCNVVPEEFLSAYILGLWDGDGCICITGKYPIFSFAGTEDVVSKLSTVLSTLVGKQINYHHKKNTKYFVFSVSGYNNIKLIREYLYKDSTIYLTRKRNKMFSF